jgi:hypothetical protein
MNRRKHLAKVLVAMVLTAIACNSKTPLEETDHLIDVTAQKVAPVGDNITNEGKELRQEESKVKLNASNNQSSLKISYASEEDMLKNIGFGQQQTETVCRQHAQKLNRIIKAFCIDKIKPKNLIELQRSLGLAITDPTLLTREENGTGGNPGFALLGHSTSLVGRSVNALNPRAIIFTPPDSVTANNLNFTILSFVRGEQLVEFITFDSQSRSLEFYLLHFTQDCNLTSGGCKPGELLSPEIEKNWVDVTLYSADQLANTALDCLHCHQPNGPRGPKNLRMQELSTPWSHWFSNDTDGLALINDYYAMHGKNETYAGIPGPLIAASSPLLLENLLVKLGFRSAQVNEFKSADIESQIKSSNPRQPADNSIPGISETWKLQYEQSKQSLLPPIPYHDLKITETSAAIEAVDFYKSYQQGRIPARTLPDFSDLFKSDQNERAKMGFAIEKEASATEILIRSCGQCHNSRLDQSLSKSRFNVDLESIDNRVEILNEAIRRVQMGYSREKQKSLGIKYVTNVEQGSPINIVDFPIGSHIETMPPRRFRQLTDEQIDALIALFISKKI